MDVEKYNSLLEKINDIESLEELEELDTEIQNFLEGAIKKDNNDWQAEYELGAVFFRKINSLASSIDDRIEQTATLNRAFEHIKRSVEIQQSLYKECADFSTISADLADTVIRFVNRLIQLLNELFFECNQNPTDSTYFSASMDVHSLEDKCAEELYSLGDGIEANYGEKQSAASVTLWKCANDIIKESDWSSNLRKRYAYSKKIHKYDESYKIINVEDRYKPLDEKIEIVKKIAEKGGDIPDKLFEEEDLISYEIPEGIVNIGKEAFYKCKNLESIIIPEGVKEIKFRAFGDCGSLKSVTIPASVEKIDMCGFDCTGVSILNVAALEEVVFAKKSKLKAIGDSAFNHCSRLSNISLPISLKEIGDWAFIGTGIQEVTVPHFAPCSKRVFPKDCKIKEQTLIPWIIAKIKSLFEK